MLRGRWSAIFDYKPAINPGFNAMHEGCERKECMHSPAALEAGKTS